MNRGPHALREVRRPRNAVSFPDTFPGRRASLYGLLTIAAKNSDFNEAKQVIDAMTQHARDELGRMRFDWPEPLVIDIIRDLYADLQSFADRMTLARLQADALRDLFEGRDRRAMAGRLELIAFSVPRGIGVERIARADRAVLLELTRIAAARFRTSPRTRAELGDALQAALGRLAKQVVPVVDRLPARTTRHAEAA